MAAACIFLAGKVGEQPKKLKPLITALHEKMPRQTADIEPLNEKSFNEMKIRMLGNERVLLQQLCFDLSVENSSAFLFKYARVVTVNQGEKMPNPLVQKAHELIGDSYETTICVEYPPQIIAVALLHLAAKLNKPKCTLDEPDEKPWYSRFMDANIDAAITDIGHRVLDVYASKPPPMTVSTDGASPASPAMSATGGTHGGVPGLAPVDAQHRRVTGGDSRRSASQDKHQSTRHHPY
jgi:cyclin K